MAKNKPLPSKSALKLQIAFFIVQVLVLIVPLVYIFHMIFLSLQTYFMGTDNNVQSFDINVFYFTLVAFTGVLALLLIFYKAGKLIQKRWQNYQSLEIERERIHDLLEDKALEDVPETEVYQKLSAKTKLEL